MKGDSVQNHLRTGGYLFIVTISVLNIVVWTSDVYPQGTSSTCVYIQSGWLAAFPGPHFAHHAAVSTNLVLVFTSK